MDRIRGSYGRKCARCGCCHQQGLPGTKLHRLERFRVMGSFENLPEAVATFLEEEGVLLPHVTLRRTYASIKAFSDEWWSLQDAVVDVEDAGILRSEPDRYRDQKLTRERQLEDQKDYLTSLQNIILQNFEYNIRGSVNAFRTLNAPYVYFHPKMPWMTTTLLHPPIFREGELLFIRLVSDSVVNERGVPCASEAAKHTARQQLLVVKSHIEEAGWDFITGFKCWLIVQNGTQLSSEGITLDRDGPIAASLELASFAYFKILEDELKQDHIELPEDGVFKPEQEPDHFDKDTVVFHPHLRRFGVIERVVGCEAYVNWEPYSETVGKKRRNCSHRLDLLIPTPVKNIIPPCVTGERVVVVATRIFDLIGKTGVVLRMHPEKCTVRLDGEQKSRSFPLGYLHRLDASKPKLKSYGELRGFKLGPHTEKLIQSGRTEDGFGVQLIKPFIVSGVGRLRSKVGEVNTQLHDVGNTSDGFENVEICQQSISVDVNSCGNIEPVKVQRRVKSPKKQREMLDWRLSSAFDLNKCTSLISAFMSPDGGGNAFIYCIGREERIATLKADTSGTIWLTDAEVDLYAHYVLFVLRNQVFLDSEPNIFLADTCFYKGLFQSSNASTRIQFDGFWRQIPLSVEYIFFLVIGDNHFSLMLVGFPHDIDKSFAIHFDSLYEGGLGEMHSNILKQFLLNGQSDASRLNGFEITTCTVPRQHDLCSCGPFTLLFFQRLAWTISQGVVKGQNEVIDEAKTWAGEPYKKYSMQVRTDIIKLMEYSANNH